MSKTQTKNTLKVVASPSNTAEDVGDNNALINPENYKNLGEPKYLSVNKCIFSVRPHPKIDQDAIALNKFQRESAFVSPLQEIPIKIVNPTDDPKYYIATMTVEVSLVNAKTVETELVIDAKVLTEYLQKVFLKQIFKKDQRWIVCYQSSYLLCKVTNIASANEKILYRKDDDEEEEDEKDKDTFTISALEGMTFQKTNFKLDKPKDVPIRFTNLPQGDNNLIVEVDFEKLGIGGLDKEFRKLFRRAFTSRVFPPDMVEKLGIKHVKGIMLFGPPGTGKTLIARQIGKMLKCKEPKVVNGPEILNKYVGQSEENVRALFKEAEEEYKQKKEASQVHLIIFDEIDAICKQRGSVKSGTGVNDSVVNQLLSKMDGVEALNNILIIGMTNRLDMIDDALLRPGRFECQIEIGLPDEKGRLQIFRIHTKKMQENQYLDQSVDLNDLAKVTKNYSGAEIEGVVKSATSFAMNKVLDVNKVQKSLKELNNKSKQLLITKDDFENALIEVKPAFGVSTDDLEGYLNQEMVDFGTNYKKLMNTCTTFIKQVRDSHNTQLLSFLLEGEAGSGKTSVAAYLGKISEYPYVKIVSAERMVGYDERSKCDYITKVFNDAYKSPLSIVILDSIERLIELVNMSSGIRFSNVLLQTLLVLIKKKPPKGRKLLIIGTTNMKDVLREMELGNVFNATLNVPLLTTTEDKKNVLIKTKAFQEGKELEEAIKSVPTKIGIKQLLLIIEMARSRMEKTGKVETEEITLKEFQNCISDIGLEDF